MVENSKLTTYSIMIGHYFLEKENKIKAFSYSLILSFTITKSSGHLKRISFKEGLFTKQNYHKILRNAGNSLIDHLNISF
jgi:hypothetical protein